MCLISKHRKLKVAAEDITCWKMLLRHPHCMVTPHIGRHAQDDVVSGEKPFEAEGGRDDGKCCKRFGSEYVYDVGFVHTYADKFTATFMAYRNGYQVYECVIPKGARYVDGRDGSGDRGYASERIKFVRPIV